MRLPYEKIEAIAKEAGNAGEGNALLVVDMEDGVTGITVCGDTWGVIYGISRAVMRLSDISGIHYKYFIEGIEGLCKDIPNPDGEVVVKGEIKSMKRGN